MGLFGKKKESKFCPICGEEMKGKSGSEKTADGEVCVLCWQRFREKSMAPLSEFTTAEIQGIIEGKDGVNGEPCPVCGEPMDENAKAIADAVICKNCARLERGTYFKTITYRDRYTDRELIPGEINQLKHQGEMDRICMDVEDELDDVTLAFVKEDIELGKKHRADALAKCGSAKEAVAYVDESFSDGKKTVLSVGVAKGEFQENDEVVLVHNGEEKRAKIHMTFAAEGESYEDVRDNPGTEVGDGGCGWLVFKDVEPEYVLDDVVYK